jgi:hypothetical protein
MSPDQRFAGSNPAEGDGFLRAIKLRSTTSFGGEVKPSVLCRKILRRAKDAFEVWKRYFIKQNSFHLSVTPALLLDESAGRIARQLRYIRINQHLEGNCRLRLLSPYLTAALWHCRAEDHGRNFAVAKDNLSRQHFRSAHCLIITVRLLIKDRQRARVCVVGIQQLKQQTKCRHTGLNSERKAIYEIRFFNG